MLILTNGIYSVILNTNNGVTENTPSLCLINTGGAGYSMYRDKYIIEYFPLPVNPLDMEV